MKAFPIILSKNLSKNHDISNFNTFFRVFKNECFIAKISKRADTFSWECNKSAAFATFEKKKDLIKSCFNLFKFRGVSMHNLARHPRTERYFFSLVS